MIPRTIWKQHQEHIELVADKIRTEVFKFDRENMYSIDDLCKELPRFDKVSISAAIAFLKKKEGVLLCFVYGNTEYYAHMYV